MTADDHERLLAREKPAYDGAEPSGTSVALLSALRLAAFTGDDRWRAIAERGAGGPSGRAVQNPLASPRRCSPSTSRSTGRRREIVVITPRDAGSSRRNVVGKVFLPNAVRAFIGTGAAAGPPSPRRRAGAMVADKLAIDGRPTAYVCVHGRCDLPVHEPEALAALLARTRPAR